MPSFLKPLQQANKFKVPTSQWRKWPDFAQRVFNEVYDTMRYSQSLMVHPKGGLVGQEYWNTTAWNAAWTAADAVVHALDDIIDGKGYARAPKKK